MGAKKLQAYRARRHFQVTPEPSGDAPSARVQPEWTFVVQKHAARRLHYDFRLELDGVLLSWAVPKGPSLEPGVKRLAARTEDHPLEYASFEGIIPQKEYGGGTVVVWDRGTWQPEGDPREGMKKGRLTFTLFGEKLKGRWHLVKTAQSWLLFKGKDDAASDRDITVERPESVLTGRTVEEVAFTNLDKVLFPEQGLTKGQLIAYLAVVSEHLLAHAGGRPLTLMRCPQGRHKKCFFQKHAVAGTPRSVRRIDITEGDGEVGQYLYVEDLGGVVALAQLGVLEIHTWGCHVDNVERPDQLVFDIDPDIGLGWDEVVATAQLLRDRLGTLGLESFVKTTGGKGLHVVAPIVRRTSWDDFKAFARAVAEDLEREHPSRYTTNPLKARRTGKLFLDYLRNSRGASAVAAYSPRAREGATVATPITWEELDAGVKASDFTVLTIPRRLANLRGDPWDGYDDLKQSISGKRRSRR